tara:strand:- start:503 stop:661 length:159 start_codon:yes stop_codon:yes gene_type:complete
MSSRRGTGFNREEGTTSFTAETSNTKHRGRIAVIGVSGEISGISVMITMRRK